MLYPGFVAALDNIALQHSDVRKAADVAAAKALVERVIVSARPEGTREGGEMFRPDNQRLLVLLQKYILVKSEAGREVQSIMATSYVTISLCCRRCCIAGSVDIIAPFFVSESHRNTSVFPLVSG